MERTKHNQHPFSPNLTLFYIIMHTKLENKQYLQDNNNPDNNNNINIQYTYSSTLKYKAITNLVSFDIGMVFQNLPGDEKQKVIVPKKTVTVCTTVYRIQFTFVLLKSATNICTRLCQLFAYRNHCLLGK